MQLTAGQQLVYHALQIGALELLPEGRKLKSGRLSPHFFNSGLFTKGSDLAILGNAYAFALHESNIPFNVIFGPAYKGITLSAISAMKMAELYDRDVFYCFNRKEVKTHGEGGQLVGVPHLTDNRIALVDDVITDGATKKEAVEIVRTAGGTVVILVLAFDRMERATGKLSAAQEFSAEYDIPVSAAANLDDLLVVLKLQTGHPSMIQKIEDYRAQYGV